MSATLVQFEASEETMRAFDDIAASRSMTRQEALRDLLEAHLAYDKAFRASVERGMQQADAGQTVAHSEIRAQLEQWQGELYQSE